MATLSILKPLRGIQHRCLRILRAMLGRPSPRTHVQRCLSPALGPMACIDVGASFGVFQPWQLLLSAPQVTWLAVEPNLAEAGYLQAWSHAARLLTCSEGLSGTGGKRQLYITNNANGSSILEPRIPASIASRSDYKGFFLPFRQIEIDTITLEQLANRLPAGLPFVIKLDTQGSELEILQGGQSLLSNHDCVGIELEASLLAEPPYTNAARFWQINGWLEGLGYELMRLTPICFGSRYAVVGGAGRKAPAECDALFTVRSDIAAGLPASHRLALLAFHCTNAFYEEAHAMLISSDDLPSLITANGGDVQALERALRSAF